MRSFLAQLGCIGVSFGMWACGGAAQSDLFGAPGDGGVTADDAMMTTTTTQPDSSTPSDTSISIADTTTVTPVPDSSSTGADTNPPDMPDTNPGDKNGLPCGSTTCQGTQACCAGGDVPNVTFTCEDETACTGVPITCHVGADCPSGELCCGQQTGGGQGTHYTSVDCESQCDGIVFCDPSGNDCAAGYTCSKSMLLPGYNVCRMM